MKRIFSALALLLVSAGIAAYAQDWHKVEVSSLNLVGKAFETANPYHRIDTSDYKGFDKSENGMCREPAGLAVLFRTDATTIGVSAEFQTTNFNRSAYCSYRGFDLYIKNEKGGWTWAGCTTFDRNEPGNVRSIVKDMAPGLKECIMYLPLRSELVNCQVCVPQGSTLETLESPFRHKIVFHGSSFTHGVSCTRAGMSYPMQFMRRTGMQVIPLGFSGHCRMQPYFAKVIEDIEADAYVFDPFSNLPASTIIERFMPFFERVVKAHPDKPIIIQRTIWWERSNFNTSERKVNTDRWAASDSLCRVLCNMYPNVYYIKPDAAMHDGECSSADGTHPTDMGYTLWERSIEKPILKIFRKYGIK